MYTLKTPRVTGDKLGDLIFGPDYTKTTPEQEEAQKAGGVLDLYSDVLDTYYSMPFNNRWLPQPAQKPFPSKEQAEYGEAYAPVTQPTAQFPIPNLSQLMGTWEGSLFEPSQNNLSTFLQGLFQPNNMNFLRKLLGI